MTCTIRRITAIGLVCILLITLLPVNALAWKSATHINSAELLLLALERSAAQSADGRASVTLYVPFGDAAQAMTYPIPPEYQEALFGYPQAFRAGSLGPDFYPDLVTGQSVIHPYNEEKDIGSGEWITLLCESVNQMPRSSEARKEALAFTLGVMLHHCGDLFGHDFINMFSGGGFPPLLDIDIKNIDGDEPDINIILSHMAQESYMDGLVNFDYFGAAGALDLHSPTRFVADTMVFDGSADGGPAAIYDRYGSMPLQYAYLVELRMTVYRKAEEWRTSINPLFSTAVAYMDRWVADLDRAVYALVDCFDLIAQDMSASEAPGTQAIMMDRLNTWLEEYGVYAAPTPDLLADVLMAPGEIVVAILEAIGAGALIERYEEWKLDLIVSVTAAALGIPQALLDENNENVFYVRLEDPAVQLDHPQNPFDPTGEKQNFAAFKEYMDRYAAEQALLDGLSREALLSGSDGGALDTLLDSELEAFYNTMVMFQLVLMGPENFTAFLRSLTGRTQTMYRTNTATLAATSLRLVISTADAQNAGTDDNVFAVVYRVQADGSRTQLIRKLLDQSVTNDFEAGSTDTYDIELPQAVPVDEIEIALEQQEKVAAYSGWNCANVDVIPMHAGTALIPAVGVGGNAWMDSGKVWDLRYQDALNARAAADKAAQTVTNLKVTIATADTLGAGTDDDIFLVAYDTAAPESAWVKVLLDKTMYNDFERGDADTYDVSLNRYVDSTTLAGLPLNRLGLKIVQEGSGLVISQWDVAGVTVTPCYGSLALTEPVACGGRSGMEDGSVWDLGFQSRALVLTDYEKPALSYPTAVDDGLLAYQHSLDDSTQWINEENLLWADTAVRRDVFFRLFKGFAPDIASDGPQTILQGEPLDMSFTLRGMWNGVEAARRNAGVSGLKAPAVTGTAAVSFLNADGQTVCTTQSLPLSAADEPALLTLSRFTHAALVPGVYDVRVTYTPDSRHQYAGTEAVFPAALTVLPQEEYTITFHGNGGSGYMPAQTFAARIPQALTPNAFTLTDHLFDGWNTAPDGSGTAFADGQLVLVDADTTLYAQWRWDPEIPLTGDDSTPLYWLLLCLLSLTGGLLLRRRIRS